MVVGNMAVQNFYNAKTGKGIMTPRTAGLDFMNKPVFTIFDTNSYYQSKYPSGGMSRRR